MKKFEARWENQKFVIEEDLPEVGWYLYVYDNDDKCIADHLQDNLTTIIEFAKEEFRIPKSEWREVNE